MRRTREQQCPTLSSANRESTVLTKHSRKLLSPTCGCVRRYPSSYLWLKLWVRRCIEIVGGPMAKYNLLNARQVESIKGDGVHADGAGLYLRVRGSARSWIFIFHLGGKRREMGLGAPPAVGLAKARVRAQAARELLADGADPLKLRETARETPTFGAFADQWIKNREASVRSSKSIDRWKRLLGDNGPAASRAALQRYGASSGAGCTAAREAAHLRATGMRGSTVRGQPSYGWSWQ